MDPRSSKITSTIDHPYTEVLIQRAQRGDREAFTEIVGRYRDRVLEIAVVRIGARLAKKVDAEGIVQETLIKAWAHVGHFDARDAPQWIDWLAKIAHNCIRDEVKKWSTERRDVDREVELEALGPTGDRESSVRLPGNAPTPSRVASAREQAEIYTRCLAELPEHYREVILLSEFAGMEWEDIAARLARPNAEAAAQLCRRARKRLKRLLDLNGFELPSVP